MRLRELPRLPRSHSSLVAPTERETDPSTTHRRGLEASAGSFTWKMGRIIRAPPRAVVRIREGKPEKFGHWACTQSPPKKRGSKQMTGNPCCWGVGKMAGDGPCTEQPFGLEGSAAGGVAARPRGEHRSPGRQLI